MTEQGFCIINNKDPRFMFEFDELDSVTRALVREAKYDLCVLCLLEIKHRYRLSMHEAVRLMEQAVVHGWTDRDLDRMYFVGFAQQRLRDEYNDYFERRPPSVMEYYYPEKQQIEYQPPSPRERERQNWMNLNTRKRKWEL